MKSIIRESLETLYSEGKLRKPVVLWGIGSQTPEVIEGLRDIGSDILVHAIVDNFKDTFYQEYMGIPVCNPQSLMALEKDSVIVLLAVNHADNIRRQLEAYGISEIYNLRSLTEGSRLNKCELSYYFLNRSKGRKSLCYVLAGYEQTLWDTTLARIEAFQSEEFDYCIVSSGKYDSYLDELAARNQWSYLYTEQNQVCFIQNLVVSLHPDAEYIIKMDEDIFIGKDFFTKMLNGFQRAEAEGEYRIGFAAPVIPLNCSGYVSYLDAIGGKEDYEQKFGRAYRSRFSAVFSIAETAEYLWDTMDTFDDMADRFAQNSEYKICDCYFNIGCIMFTRNRWLMMGKWPENPDETGMGIDEGYIYRDNCEKDMSIYEIQGALAGHLAFGHQKQRMLKYYQEHMDKFRIHK